MAIQGQPNLNWSRLEGHTVPEHKKACGIPSLRVAPGLKANYGTAQRDYYRAQPPATPLSPMPTYLKPKANQYPDIERQRAAELLRAQNEQAERCLLDRRHADRHSSTLPPPVDVPWHDSQPKRRHKGVQPIRPTCDYKLWLAIIILIVLGYDLLRNLLFD
jgi:hypothetical protein